VDFGSHSVRAGYSGEELPKCVFPNAIGVLQQPERQTLFDSIYLDRPRPGMEVCSPMKNGLVDNWELFEELLAYTLDQRLNGDVAHSPLMMTDPAWNTKEKRIKLTELIFEKFNSIAFYLVKSPVCTTFANGKSSGIVLDAGATHTTAVAVYEGHILRRSITSSPLGSNFLQNSIGEYLKKNEVDLSLRWEITDRNFTEINQNPIFKKKAIAEVTQSWRSYQTQLILEDISKHVFQISDISDASNSDELSKWPSEVYEFPTGYRKAFGAERFKIAEPLFNPALVEGSKTTTNGVADLVTNSLHKCDADIRSALMSNVIITGGNSLISGFTERLVAELQKRTPPALRFKLVNQQTGFQATTERLFSPWIGGSILSSLGTFHQMWISKKDYEESGGKVVEAKCF